MNFKEEYQKITSVVSDEMKAFETFTNNELFGSGNEISGVLSEFFQKKGKMLRPLLIFLLTRAMNCETNENQIKLAFADEMIHNATLIHDDIIDCALLRREAPAIHAAYDSKLAVLAGDYLLTLALKALGDFENPQIIKIHTGSISNIVNGEIGQYFERGKVVSIEEYINKSRNKTGELFKAGLESAVILCGSDKIAEAGEFALNFGTAFQIHNDLKDALKGEVSEDFKNKIYTAPWIYSFEEGDKNSYMLKNTAAEAKTRELIDSFINRAIENLSFLRDNQYKESLKHLCNLYKYKG